MHRCLQIAEVLDIILHILGGDPSHYGRTLYPSALAALARTCHALSEPALDVLWEKQNTLMRVILCLPTDCWIFVDEHDGNCGMIQVLILRLGMDDDAGCREYPSRNALYILEEYRLSGALFPYLRELRFYADDLRYWKVPNMFLTATLKTLGFTIEEYADLTWKKVTSFLADVTRIAPNLGTLTMGICQANQDPPPSLSFILANFHQLKKLSIDMLDQDFLISAMRTWSSSLPYLTGLHINSRDEHPPPTDFGFTSGIVSSSQFKSLKNLCINFKHLSSACATLQLLDQAPLAELIVCMTDYGENVGRTLNIQHLLNTIAAHCSHAALKTLRLLQGVDANEPDYLQFYHIQPLLVYRNLEDIMLDFDSNLRINDEQLKQMAIAWPHLSYLSIPFRLDERPRIFKSDLTLASLEILTTTCLRLRSLLINIDTSHATRPKEGSGTGSLRELDVDWSPVSESAAVAAFLTSVFPQPIEVSSHESSPFRDEWREVSYVVKTRQSRRANATRT
ncbi:hypothetical protein CERSUDRAFT_77137 [Gelatoporia subvermispora B]|uniref:F-box domain-containing protein n=1 Tax=Ceriporiopsis subvermispora (strain B) TaxID=914234 RepID=M2R1I4_CERS8|nr:hypothetical protein CERSUDRAFT_77137 [Gelatoporia subvermispora B]